jgi:hypothetical protein
VTTGGCGCEAAPAPAANQGGHLFHRLFGKKPAAPAAPEAAPACGCGAHGTPVPAYGYGTPGYPTIIGGAPAPGTLPPGTITGTPLPTGNPNPEGVKEAPKDPQKLPGGNEKKEEKKEEKKDITPAGGLRIESEGRNPFDSHHLQQARSGCAADYSWVTGQLSFVHADGGTWVLRYAPLDQEDRHGGSVVLGRGDRRLDSYRDGDIVTVKGEILTEKYSQRLTGPLYRINAIQLVERPTE